MAIDFAGAERLALWIGRSPVQRKSRIGSHLRRMSEQFYQSNRQGYPHQCELENSGIRVWSVIAMSLNVGDGVRIIKPAKLSCARKNTTDNDDGRTAPAVRGYGSKPLSHSGSVIMRIELQQKQLISPD
ncbi:MAG: hypothetical protein AB2695_19595, partial [Candidatus Thiodiazotropha endolucinida]